jgi:hypothetical protein
MDGDCVRSSTSGIAKRMHSDLSLTGTGAALGSPLYAREQMNGSRDVDARAVSGELVSQYEALAQVTRSAPVNYGHGPHDALVPVATDAAGAVPAGRPPQGWRP